MNYSFILVGNPNCGKTTLFNLLTGSSRTVGNWSGVTVDCKTGLLKNGEDNITITDLPGMYSLDSDGADERVAQRFLRNYTPDTVINVIDASLPERSLMLTLNLISLGMPVVLAINMIDSLADNGIEINTSLLQSRLGIPVVPISAKKRLGIDVLLDTAKCAKKPEKKHSAANNDYIDRLVDGCYSGQTNRFNGITAKIDRVVTDRILAFPIFVVIMLLIFTIAFGVPGNSLTAAAAAVCTVASGSVQSLLSQLGCCPEVISLVCDGVLAGLGSVITLLPKLALLFFMLSGLEDCGYMARAAFITDSILRSFRLSGRSFIPLLLGFGCTVPAVMSTRALEGERNRLLTAIVLPMIPCSARLPVITMLAAAFFGYLEPFVIFVAYLLAAALTLLSARVLSPVAGNTDELFVLEMPAYHLPGIENMLRHTWVKIKVFAIKAVTVLLLAFIAIWLLDSYTPELHYTPNGENSIFRAMATTISPVFVPLGFGNTVAVCSLLSGVVAKEAIAGTLVIMCSDATTVFCTASAAAFICFCTLYTPCIAAITALKRELNSLRLIICSLIWQFFIAWLISFGVYRLVLLL